MIVTQEKNNMSKLASSNQTMKRRLSSIDAGKRRSSETTDAKPNFQFLPFIRSPNCSMKKGLERLPIRENKPRLVSGHHSSKMKSVDAKSTKNKNFIENFQKRDSVLETSKQKNGTSFHKKATPKKSGSSISEKMSHDDLQVMQMQQAGIKKPPSISPQKEKRPTNLRKMSENSQNKNCPSSIKRKLTMQTNSRSSNGTEPSPEEIKLNLSRSSIRSPSERRGSNNFRISTSKNSSRRSSLQKKPIIPSISSIGEAEKHFTFEEILRINERTLENPDDQTPNEKTQKGGMSLQNSPENSQKGSSQVQKEESKGQIVIRDCRSGENIFNIIQMQEHSLFPKRKEKQGLSGSKRESQLKMKEFKKKKNESVDQSISDYLDFCETFENYQRKETSFEASWRAKQEKNVRESSHFEVFSTFTRDKLAKANSAFKIEEDHDEPIPKMKEVEGKPVSEKQSNEAKGAPAFPCFSLFKEQNHGVFWRPFDQNAESSQDLQEFLLPKGNSTKEVIPQFLVENDSDVCQVSSPKASFALSKKIVPQFTIINNKRVFLNH